ncbi:hypothetical protein ABK040_015378 [Willaertia magna]
MNVLQNTKSFLQEISTSFLNEASSSFHNLSSSTTSSFSNKNNTNHHANHNNTTTNSLSEWRKSILDSFHQTISDDDSEDNEMYESAISHYSSSSKHNNNKNLNKKRINDTPLIDLEEEIENPLTFTQFEPILTRNKTKLYEKLRSSLLTNKHHDSYYSDDEENDENSNFFITDDSTIQQKELLEINNLKEEQKKNKLNKNDNDKLVKQIIDLYELFNKKIIILSKELDELKKLHLQHVTFQVGKNFENEEKLIIEKTNKLKNLFKELKSLIDQFDKLLINKEEEIKNIKELIKNIKTFSITKLSELSTNFQKEQNNYLNKLTQLKTKQKELENTYTNIDNNLIEEFTKEELNRIQQIEEKYYNEPNITKEEIDLIILQEREIIKRDKELRYILQSIIELNEMFQQINLLIMEQGTLIDRIDYNIEMTCDFVKSGNENLKRAEELENQSCNCFNSCICVLSIVIVFLTILLILKIS